MPPWKSDFHNAPRHMEDLVSCRFWGAKVARSVSLLLLAFYRRHGACVMIASMVGWKAEPVLDSWAPMPTEGTEEPPPRLRGMLVFAISILTLYGVWPTLNLETLRTLLGVPAVIEGFFKIGHMRHCSGSGFCRSMTYLAAVEGCVLPIGHKETFHAPIRRMLSLWAERYPAVRVWWLNCNKQLPEGSRADEPKHTAESTDQPVSKHQHAAHSVNK